MEVNELLTAVKEKLTESRYNHTLRVAKEAVKLARIFSVSEQKAEIAAIFHDYAKNFSVEKLTQWIKESTLPNELLQYHVELWHGPVASVIIEEQFSVYDQEIKAAIRYHTTGRQGMSDLELVIFLADYIEPGRNFPGLEEVRQVATKDLTMACWLAIRNTIQYLINQKAIIHPDSFLAYNDLTKKVTK